MVSYKQSKLRPFPRVMTRAQLVGSSKTVVAKGRMAKSSYIDATTVFGLPTSCANMCGRVIWTTLWAKYGIRRINWFSLMNKTTWSKRRQFMTVYTDSCCLSNCVARVAPCLTRKEGLGRSMFSDLREGSREYKLGDSEDIC